ncbi:MAG: hypothetical protein ACC661_06020 [Verrucomicrobiales bacterium]
MKGLTLIKRRRIGGVLLASFRQEDGTYYVEAEGNEFRVWRLTRDPDIANEYYLRFWFWSWLIEAVPSHLFLRLATWFMRR